MENKKIVGITCSTFDLLHTGHIIMLEECKKYCERYIQLDAVKYVDKIIPYNTEKELIEIFSSLDLDIRIIGEDYKSETFTAKDICQKRDIKIIYNKRDHNYSTSNLRNKIYNIEYKKRFVTN